MGFFKNAKKKNQASDAWEEFVLAYDVLRALVLHEALEASEQYLGQEEAVKEALAEEFAGLQKARIDAQENVLHNWTFCSV